MKNRKWIIPVVVVGLILLSAILALYIQRGPIGQEGNAGLHTEHYKIGVFQVVRHPVLDSMADTFEAHLKQTLPGQVEFVKMVPEGDAAKTEQMAERFATGGYNLVFVIGTNQAQSLVKKTSDVSIVLGAATDPQAAGLVKSWEQPGGNVTGTSDLSPVSSQLDRMAEILPGARRIGIIYNPAEDNSNIIVKRFEAECRKRALTPITATISNQNEIRQTLVSLVGKIDALYAPTDATIQGAFAVLIGTANELKIPVFDCDKGTVEKGAVFSVGFDYSELGRIAADMAADILLKGKSPANMPIRLADNVQLFYNLAQIANFSLTLPATWNEQGQEVSE